MKKFLKISAVIIVLLISVLFVYYVNRDAGAKYSYEEYTAVHNNLKLHTDKTVKIGSKPEKNILLIHGVTYSSHQFDIDYKDYSLVKALADAGYTVWKADISGYGRSQIVKDGFMPDSDYAAEDINAVVNKITEVTGQNKIDLFGWSWGTVTTSRFAAKYPEKINKLVLFAPILTGIGECDATEPFHHNTWEHSVSDFQRDEKGNIDNSVAEQTVVDLLASGAWHYDGETSPNGGRRDICVDKSTKLIDLSKLKTPTLVIYGDKDPYLNYEALTSIQTELPEGSSVKLINGASHVAFLEKPYYKDFRKSVVGFLK